MLQPEGSTYAGNVDHEAPMRVPVVESFRSSDSRHNTQHNSGVLRRRSVFDSFRDESYDIGIPAWSGEDCDGVSTTRFGGIGRKGAGRSSSKVGWNGFKWTLVIANTMFSFYTVALNLFVLLTWFGGWQYAEVIRIANRTELVICTFGAVVSAFTSFIGWSGILLNHRPYLAIYTLLLWLCFGFLVAPGYVTFRRSTFDLEGKINEQWSRDFGVASRLRLQNIFGCCGYLSPFVEASVSYTCYSRSMLPGCKHVYLNFERAALHRWYAISFGIVPLHLGVMIAGLLCSNHVMYRFGKGMMPSGYHLSDIRQRLRDHGRKAGPLEINTQIRRQVEDSYAPLREHYYRGLPQL